jgi:copper chaperone CopZ
MNMSTKIYNVPNISCRHCVATIERELGSVEGVRSVQGDLPTKQVTVSYDDETVPERVEKVLQEIGYPAE